MTGSTKTSHRTALAGATVALGLLAGHDAAAQAAGASDGRRLVLEEIIVTAQKRKEALQDIPQSVTVLSSETL